ncbi:MAG: tetratricopeptide repeat protein, partial [Anaerolineae bacterium]|nr:tetratricopeptide repeat protein [Anaerolineae bacterium]
EHSLDFLTTSLRNIPERHRSLRAVFDSSWNMLEDDEQQMLRQLSIFRGGFAADSARRVTGGSLLTLSALVDKSMLSQVAGRYQIHELLRQYAARKLAEHPEEQAQTQAAHSQYFAQYLEAREGSLSNNRSDTAYSEVLSEIDNIAAAWEFALDHSDQDRISRFLRPLYRLFDIQSRYLDGEALFQRAAEVLGASLTGPNDVTQARALLLQAACLQSMARYDEAEQIVSVVVPVFRAEGAPWELRIALACLGAIIYARGEYRGAQTYYEEAYELVINAGGDPVIILLRLSDIAAILGEYEKARGILEQALSFLSDRSSQHSRMRFLLTLGDINCKLGRFEEARANFQEAREYSEALKATNSGGVALVSLARVAFGTGAYAESRAYCRESIRMFEDIHNQWGKAFALIHLGKAAQALDDRAEARHHYRNSLEIAEQVGSPWLKSVALRQLGKSLLSVGDVEESLRHLQDSLRTAIEIQAIPLAVDALAGVAEYYAAHQQGEQAVSLAAFLLSQPYSEFETRRDADRVIARFEPDFPAVELERLKSQSAGQALSDVAATILELA